MEKYIQSTLHRIINLPEPDEDLGEKEASDNDDQLSMALVPINNNTQNGPTKSSKSSQGQSSNPSNRNYTFKQRQSIRLAKLLARLHFYPSMIQLLGIERTFCKNSRAYYTRIDQQVILGAIPFNEEFSQHLIKQESVGGVISLNEKYELKYFSIPWEKFGVQFLQLPTKDLFEAPSQANIKKGLEFIQTVSNAQEETEDLDLEANANEHLEKSDNNSIEGSKVKFTSTHTTVYVHCRAGRTRSASLVTCYLIQKYNWTPEEALNFLKSKHNHILIGPNQRKAIDKFYNRLIQQSK